MAKDEGNATFESYERYPRPKRALPSSGAFLKRTHISKHSSFLDLKIDLHVGNQVFFGDANWIFPTYNY